MLDITLVSANEASKPIAHSHGLKRFANITHYLVSHVAIGLEFEERPAASINSREAALESSPWRKPWVESGA